MQGNTKASYGIQLLKKMLGQLGGGENRVRLEWVAVSEPDRFVFIVEEMTERMRQLGSFNTNSGGRQDG